jgi:hypothetical protein
VFALLVPSWCNKFGTCNKLDGIKVVLTSLIQSCQYNKNVTRLTTQGCNNIVIYHDCIRLVETTLHATSLIILTRLLTPCSKLVDNLGQAVQTQLVDGLLADLLQDVRFLGVYSSRNI